MGKVGWIAVAVIAVSGSAWAASSTKPGPACRQPPASFETSAKLKSGRADWLGVMEAVRRSRLPERQHRQLAGLIVREADRNGLDPRLIAAVIHAESTFRIHAKSEVGARGLMQVMPSTGRWLLQRRGERLGPSSRLFDPELNVSIGTAYLAELIEQFGTVEHALVAYNAGPTAARRILREPARRERFLSGYPRKVMEEFERLKRQPVGEAASRTAIAGGTI